MQNRGAFSLLDGVGKVTSHLFGSAVACGDEEDPPGQQQDL